MYSPAEVARRYVETGKSKAALPVGRMLLLGMLAGAFIALAGGSATFAVSYGGGLAGAAVFPAGLAMVLLAGSELFTGNCLLVIPLLERQLTWGRMLRSWGVVYLANVLGATVSDNETIARTCDYIFLGVKPQMMADLLARLQPILSRRQEGFVLVSMAAGLTLQRLREMAGLSCPILRIMPNTACAVGAGLTLYVPSPEVTEEQLSDFLTLMSASGRLEPLEEHLIDAGSAVAGCGGAFVSLFLEALADGAVTCGLPRDKARRYAAQMVLGTAQLALQSDQHTAAMKDAVCSPGGTTIAGVRALERGGFRSAAMEAVIAAYEKTLALKS